MPSMFFHGSRRAALAPPKLCGMGQTRAWAPAASAGKPGTFTSPSLLMRQTPVGPSNAPTTGISDNFGDALYPVIGGTNVLGMDILSNSISLSGNILTVTTRIVDLSNPRATALRIAGTAFLQYITRWQMGNTIYFAAMENTPLNNPTFFAGKAQSVDLCSVSACFPHVITYPEPGLCGATDTGSIKCPSTPSASTPPTSAI